MAQAARDQNRVTALLATSNADGLTTLPVYVDSSTNRLLVDANVTLGANATVDLNRVKGTATSVNNGTADAGCQRVAIASDNTAFPVNATLSAETTKVIGTVNISAAQTIATVTTVGAVTAITNALPAGTNAIGKLSANSGVDIGDVDITSVVPGVAATSLGKAEDAVHVSGDTGVMALSVSNEAQSSFGADGDYTPQATDTKGNALVIGNVAHDGADAGAPVKVGGKATNVEPAVVSATGDRANLITDMVGKLITLPYANPENFVSGAITSAMTGTTSTSLIAAPAAGLRNYITQITVSNSHATVGTDIIIQDGSGGTTLYTIPAAPAYGGATITFPVPLRQPTTATAIFCANVTTGSNTKVSASGYKGV